MDNIIEQEQIYLLQVSFATMYVSIFLRIQNINTIIRYMIIFYEQFYQCI